MALIITDHACDNDTNKRNNYKQLSCEFEKMAYASCCKRTSKSWLLFFHASCSKFLSACRNKLQSPNSFTPFRLRTEERAARRKEARIATIWFHSQSFIVFHWCLKLCVVKYLFCLWFFLHSEAWREIQRQSNTKIAEAGNAQGCTLFPSIPFIFWKVSITYIMYQWRSWMQFH